MIDVKKIREDFPILSTKVYDKPLVYLDNGATTQKPRCVVEVEREQYYTLNANVHRGVHYLSQQATDLLEQARCRVRDFINAPLEKEIIFTRGTTEAINLVAASFGEMLAAGDEIIVSEMEHHSNIVPWQLLANRRGIVLRVIPFNEDGVLDQNVYKSLFSPKTRLVCVTHVSNVLGTVNPIKEMVAEAHAHNVPFLVDAAQSVPHIKVDVRDLGCDFLAFSGHKIYGPTGIGVLYGKSEWLDKMPPYQGGGEMISTVSFDKT
ncbi:MAG: aminotransferase class V-fold PLP-dependent enzyme, partial [Bacteroidaceae bacterium]